MHSCGTRVARWWRRRGLLLGSIMIFRHYKNHYKEHKEGYEEGNKDQDFIEAPWWGVPPPLVFDFGRFVDWKEVLKKCVVKLGVFSSRG